MNQTVPSLAKVQQGEKAGNHGWPAAVFTGMVLGAALFAFSPRPAPPFPATQVYPDRLLVNGLAENGKRLLAAGEEGHILIADDPKGPWLDAVRSEDNGQTWKEVSYNQDADQAAPLFGVAGPFEGKVYAFGAFGTLMQSADQGKTWQSLKSDAIGDKHLYGMLDGGGALLLVGEQGLMLKSTDGGASWQALKQIYNGSFFGALALPDKGWLVYGMRGHVFVSHDQGQTWKDSVTPAPLSIFGGAVQADGKIFLAGAQRTVLVSDDGGAQFRIFAQGERQTLAAVLPLADGEVLVAGEPGLSVQKQLAAANTSGAQ